MLCSNKCIYCCPVGLLALGSGMRFSVDAGSFCSLGFGPDSSLMLTLCPRLCFGLNSGFFGSPCLRRLLLGACIESPATFFTF